MMSFPISSKSVAAVPFLPPLAVLDLARVLLVGIVVSIDEAMEAGGETDALRGEFGIGSGVLDLPMGGTCRPIPINHETLCQYHPVSQENQI